MKRFHSPLYQYPTPLEHKWVSARSQVLPETTSTSLSLSLCHSNWQHHLPLCRSRSTTRLLLSPALCATTQAHCPSPRLPSLPAPLSPSIYPSRRAAPPAFHTHKTHCIPLSPEPCCQLPDELQLLCTTHLARRSLILPFTPPAQSCSLPARLDPVRARRSVAEVHRWTPDSTSAIAYNQTYSPTLCRYGFRAPCGVVLAAALCTTPTRPHHPHIERRIAAHETKPEDVVERVPASSKGPRSAW